MALRHTVPFRISRATFDTFEVVEVTAEDAPTPLVQDEGGSGWDEETDTASLLRELASLGGAPEDESAGSTGVARAISADDYDARGKKRKGIFGR